MYSQGVVRALNADWCAAVVCAITAQLTHAAVTNAELLPSHSVHTLCQKYPR